MNHLFLGLFAAFGIAHLYYSWKDERKGRVITKPFLLVFLFLYYILSAEPVKLFLALALFTSWLGDVLLIPKGHKWFTAGGISFLLSHICFILVYLGRIETRRLIWWILLPAALVYFFISFRIMNAVKENTPKAMVVPMGLYLITNSAMNIFALSQWMSLGSAGAMIAYFGAVLFFVSDCTLFLVRYHRKKDMIFRKHFTVMLTYLAGEFLITLGMLIIGG